jgi:hypothetical protein
MMGSESETGSPSLACLSGRLVQERGADAATARLIAGRVEVFGYLHSERRIACESI